MNKEIYLIHMLIFLNVSMFLGMNLEHTYQILLYNGGAMVGYILGVNALLW